jgi:AraC family L-rhamnose operon regulatory protein RhaS
MTDTAYTHDWDGRVAHLVPVNSITNHFVGLSTDYPIALYTFPYDERWEATPMDGECARRQSAITARMAAGYDVPPHDHEFYEVTIVREGHALHHTDWGDVPVGTGSIIVVPPGQVHAFTELVGFVSTNIYYQSEWLSADLMALMKQEGLVPLFLASGLFNHPAFERAVHFQMPPLALERCAREMRDICEAASVSPPALLLLNICFIKLLIILSQAYSVDAGSIGALRFRPEVWGVLEEIEECLLVGRPFSLAEVAERIGLSTRHLSLLFLRETGRRPSDYLVRRRGQHAARLLLTADDNLTNVAHTLGYTDSSHFSNQFKELYGMSPRAYRKRFSK